MTGERIAELEDVSSALAAAGYTVAGGELAGQRAVLAETPYALVGCVEADLATDLMERVADAQAALTRLASKAPSPRQWDLYLVVHVRSRPQSADENATLEAIEADTHYVRKFVRAAIDLEDDAALDRALRPLLPLRPAAEFDLTDPLDALRSELSDPNLPEDVATTALEAFRRGEEVAIP